LTQRQFVWRARQAADTGAFARDERVLVPMSSQEYPGKSVRLYTLLHGATAIGWPGADAASIVAHANATRATIVQLTVLQARALASADPPPERLAPSVRVLLGASQMPSGCPAFRGARRRSRLQPLRDDGGRHRRDDVSARRRRHARRRRAPRGRRGDRRRRRSSLPRDVPGEIRVRCDGMVDRYVDDPVATARHFDGGWFYPRDVGAITAAGVLRFLGGATT
jgi:acyl-CoA synthetase (AMP-forming)/AMP-acid ligase II